MSEERSTVGSVQFILILILIEMLSLISLFSQHGLSLEVKASKSASTLFPRVSVDPDLPSCPRTPRSSQRYQRRTNQFQKVFESTSKRKFSTASDGHQAEEGGEDRRFVFQLCATHPDEMKAEDLTRAVKILQIQVNKNISAEPKSWDFATRLCYHQLQRIILSFSRWLVPVSKDNENGVRNCEFFYY